MKLALLLRPISLTGAALLGAALLWHVWLADRWTQRIPRGWSKQSAYIGVLTSPDPKTGAFPLKDDVAEYDRALRVVSETDWPRSVLLEDRYTIRDVITRKVTYEYVTRARVDPKSGAHVSTQYQGEFALFPRHVERRTYVLRSSYLKGVPLAFDGVEDIQGLQTYRFAYRGRAEYTESFEGSSEYEGVKVAPGQEIRCADDQFYYRVWVEPATGAQVKLEEGCPSGDHLYDIASGRPLAPIARWNGVTLGGDLFKRVEEVRQLRTQYLLASRYFPLSLLLGGLVLLAAGTRRPRTEDAQ